MKFVVTRQKSLDFPLSPPPSQVKVPLPLFNGRSHCLITVNADPRIKWTEHNAYLIKMDSEKKLFYCKKVKGIEYYFLFFLPSLSFFRLPPTKIPNFGVTR